MPLFGIDITKWNGELNFTAVKAAGVRFAMVKASQGHALASAQYLYADTRFDRNVRGLAAVGIPAGAYHFFTASTREEAIAEAEFLLKTAAPLRDQLPLYLACEVKTEGNRYLEKLDRCELSTLCGIFCERIEEAGFKACLYTSTDTLREQLEVDAIPCPIWQAHYGSAGSVKRPIEAEDRLAIHRYTSDGQLIGIPGSFGLNFGYAPIAQRIIKQFTPLDDERIEAILRAPTGDEILIRLADRLISKSLKPIKDTSTEKLASLIRYHCMLSFAQTEYLLTCSDAKEVIDALYKGMLRQ